MPHYGNDCICNAMNGYDVGDLFLGNSLQILNSCCKLKRFVTFDFNFGCQCYTIMLIQLMMAA